MTPGDLGTLTEEMEHLGTSDYMGARSECALGVFPGRGPDADSFPVSVQLGMVLTTTMKTTRTPSHSS